MHDCTNIRFARTTLHLCVMLSNRIDDLSISPPSNHLPNWEMMIRIHRLHSSGVGTRTLKHRIFAQRSNTPLARTVIPAGSRRDELATVLHGDVMMMNLVVLPILSGTATIGLIDWIDDPTAPVDSMVDFYRLFLSPIPQNMPQCVLSM